jgi:hypothetical protein
MASDGKKIAWVGMALLLLLMIAWAVFLGDRGKAPISYATPAPTKQVKAEMTYTNAKNIAKAVINANVTSPVKLSINPFAYGFEQIEGDSYKIWGHVDVANAFGNYIDRYFEITCTVVWNGEDYGYKDATLSLN